MKKLIKKLAVVLTLVIAVMSFPSSAFAATACSNCGSTNTKIVEAVYNTAIKERGCPQNNLKLDLMITNTVYERLHCNNCGFEGPLTYIGKRYEVTCVSSGQYFIVALGHDMAHGYDLHCSLNYWLYGTVH